MRSEQKFGRRRGTFYIDAPELRKTGVDWLNCGAPQRHSRKFILASHMSGILSGIHIIESNREHQDEIW